MTSEQEKAGRTEKGRFAPGHSGNPGGRPKTAARYRRLLHDQLTDAQFVGIVDKLLELAHHGDVKAIRLCLEYCIGKPKDADPEADEGPRPDELAFEYTVVDGTEDINADES